MVEDQLYELAVTQRDNAIMTREKVHILRRQRNDLLSQLRELELETRGGIG